MSPTQKSSSTEISKWVSISRPQTTKDVTASAHRRNHQKMAQKTTVQLNAIRDERKAKYASWRYNEDEVQQMLDKAKTGEETRFEKEFVVKKVAESRRECEYLFEDRRLIQADHERAFQTGEGRIGSVPHLRGRKTSNWKRIEILLRTQVEFWEKEHCRLNRVPHTDYPLDVMNSWRCGDTYFPVWTDLRDADGNLIVMTDVCPNAVVRNLALRHLIVMADKERMKEEAVLLEVELARVKRFHERRASVLKRALIAKEQHLWYFVITHGAHGLQEANDHENDEDDKNDEDDEDDENQIEDGTAHGLFLDVVEKQRVVKALVEGDDWKKV
jgi:hypothetical protein